MSLANSARSCAPCGLREPVERHGRHRIVGLASEEVPLGEDPHDVVGAADPRLGELVDHVVADDRLREHADAFSEPIDPVTDPPLGVLARTDLRAESGRVPRGRTARIASPLRFSQWPSRSLSRLHAQAAPPSRNANRNSGNRIGTPPKNKRARGELAGGGEVPDVVEHVVGRRRARAPARSGRVKRRRHAELDALLPKGV